MSYEMRISDWSSDVCSSDLQKHDQWRQIERAEIGHDLADRAIDRIGDLLERVPHRADEFVVQVDDVEPDQPGHDRLNDNDPPQDVEQNRQDLKDGDQAGLRRHEEWGIVTGKRRRATTRTEEHTSE